MRDLRSLSKIDSDACSSATKCEIGSSEADIRRLAEEVGIYGKDPQLIKAIEKASRHARFNVPVLILGKRGTGKELFARFIHKVSGLEKFVVCNCSCLTPELADSTLFGHLKGSFTGAFERKVGLFEYANGGTLFLDELAEIPMTVQAKLLRVLEDGMVVPVGATTGREVNVRVISATNKDLDQQIKDGLFREDLFDRLNVGRIDLPPLNERKADLRPLAMRVLKKLCVSIQREKTFSDGALLALQNYSWPGNVREFENTILRSIIESGSKEILEADDLVFKRPFQETDPFAFLPEPHEGFSVEEHLGKERNELYRRAMQIAKNNKEKAGRLLGVTGQAVTKHFQRAN